MRSDRWLNLFEPLLAWVTFLTLVLLLYARFFVVPYAGLYFSPEGEVVRVYVDGPLREGDQLVKVGPVRWTDFQADLRQSVFQGVAPGESVPIEIERNGVTQTVDWVFPGRTPQEFWPRFYSEWPLALAFWLAGVITLLAVRPRDSLWRLMIVFNFLTAIWLIAGSTVSRWQMWEGALILRAGVWLSVPVYLHLHWNFPKPLGRLPRAVLWVMYLGAGAMAVAALAQFTPRSLFFVGFAAALLGSVVLLLAHAVFQPAQRGQVGRLVVLWAVALLPAVVIGIAGVVSRVPAFSGGVLVGLPFLPAAYLYTAFRRRLGPHEVRANRLLALYVFIIVWVGLLAVLVPLLESLLPDSMGLVTFLVAILSVASGALALPRFQRWVERRLLGATWPVAGIVDQYAERITTSLDTPSLVRVLTEAVLPSLLIRESALVRSEAGRLTTLYAQNVGTDRLPTEHDLPKLAAHTGLTPIQTEGPGAAAAGWPCDWTRVCLPLRVHDQLAGVWLLGRRDPDDYYSAADLTTLKTLAHQTAIALTNIVYAERLHALYQNAIDQREAERVSLSRELHDNTLQRLFDLRRSVADEFNPQLFDRQFETVAQGLAQTIRGLRPPMLEYGLYRALVALVDDWANRPEVLELTPPIVVECAVPESEARYPHAIEQHLYRIVQQAGDNALEHAGADRLTVTGRLDAQGVELTVEDNGRGFDPDHLLNLSALEAQGHFGLAGMQERAALIGARIQFDSAPGRGTRIRLEWRTEAN